MSEIRRSSNPVEAGAGSGGYLIGPRLAGAIKSLLDQNEKGVNSTQNIRLETRFEETRQQPQKVFRICTFTGSWATATLKTVTFKYQTNTPNTVSAMNLTMHLPDIGLTPPYYDCAIAKDGTAWYLVSAIEHNVKKGTFSAPWNKGETKTVTLVNGGSVTATNRHASVAGTGTKNCTVGRDEMEWELIAAEC